VAVVRPEWVVVAVAGAAVVVLLCGTTTKPSSNLLAAKVLEHLALEAAASSGFAQLREVVRR
jgi:hypothetical protein